MRNDRICISSLRREWRGNIQIGHKRCKWNDAQASYIMNSVRRKITKSSFELKVGRSCARQQSESKRRRRCTKIPYAFQLPETLDLYPSNYTNNWFLSNIHIFFRFHENWMKILNFSGWNLFFLCRISNGARIIENTFDTRHTQNRHFSIIGIFF